MLLCGRGQFIIGHYYTYQCTFSIVLAHGYIFSHSLPVDVTLAVFSVGAQNTEGWDFLYSKYQSSLSSTEKSQIEFALCTSQNKEKIQW
jgi:hypothetical protein